jgi:hypothetical protein
MITGTRIDSAAKHQVACRVDYERMLSWVGYDHLLLQREKWRYCMHKDDMVIGCSVPVRSNEPARTSGRNKAYPSVVVTLADMQEAAICYLVALYHNSTTWSGGWAGRGTRSWPRSRSRSCPSSTSWA